MMTSSSQHEGGQQQRLRARGKDRVARLDGELAVAQLMRQANLPVGGMASLRTVEIGKPQCRTVAVHHLADHAGATAVTDDVDHHLDILEDPIPAGAAIHADARFIGTHHAGTPRTRQDRADLGIQPRLDMLEGAIQRALADRQAEQFQHHAVQPLVADRVG